MSLEDFIQKNRKFIQLGDGDSYKGFFHEAKEGVNQDGNPTMFYYFKDDKDSNPIPLKSSSVKLAVQMAKYKAGDFLKVTRTGEAKNTKYVVEEATPF